MSDEKGPVMWNPYNKVVQDHRDGTIDYEATNVERAKRGLPIPWKPEFADKETERSSCFTRQTEQKTGEQPWPMTH